MLGIASIVCSFTVSFNFSAWSPLCMSLENVRLYLDKNAVLRLLLILLVKVLDPFESINSLLIFLSGSDDYSRRSVMLSDNFI